MQAIRGIISFLSLDKLKNYVFTLKSQYFGKNVTVYVAKKVTSD
jgi:hypothetical protein